MALFDGTLLRAVGQNIVPAAAGMLGGYLGGRLGAPAGTQTPVAATAVAPSGAAPSAVAKAAGGSSGGSILDQKIMGIPMIAVLAVGAFVAYKFLK